MKNHKVYTISAIPFNSDLISGKIWELDIEGISENENSLTVYAKESSLVNKQKIEEELNDLLKENLIEKFEIEESSIEEINWNEEWEKNLKPIRVSDRIVIKQSYQEIETDPNTFIITIDPKMSFGTGEHETTKLILQMIEEFDLSSKSVLDIGSGTAVLAIAAAKLGSKNVIAIDNDEWCLHNGNENVKLNEVERFVDVRLGEIDDITESSFDLILANINKNILIEIAEKICGKAKENGEVILSGLLIDDEEYIKRVYKNKGLRFIQSKRMNEWTALKFIKTKSD